MHFLKSILRRPDEEATPKAVVRKESRRAQRYAISPNFPLKAVLCFSGRDGMGTPLSGSRVGWDLKGRLVDFSELGARLQLGPAALGTSGDFCELRLSLGGIVLEVPCHVTNVRVESEGLHYGLKLDFTDVAKLKAYRQLLDIVALGARLKLHFKKPKPDDSGYLVEQYASDRQSRLTVWRDSSDRTVSAFEFLLRDCLVRAAKGQRIEHLSGTDTAEARKATPAKSTEIQRLFQWVVPNLAPAVPADVRAFLQPYAD